jgi:hypothetical protein
MPIIRLTKEEKRLAGLTPMPLNYTGDVSMRIEDASDCEGIGCGERMESVLSAGEYQLWLETHPARPPVAAHSHLIVHGDNPKTLEATMAIFK